MHELKQKGPSNKQQQRGRGESSRGVGQRGGQQVHRPSGDRSLLGRRYETGAALRSTGAGTSDAQSQDTGSELERVVDTLHEEHGEALVTGSEMVGVPAEATAAIVLTETSQMRGVSEDLVAVRFEPYEFFRRTGKWLVATHRDQAAEHRVFSEAKAIDVTAAHESLRMGVAQLSGQEAQAAGYETSIDMYAGMQSGEEAQIEGLISVIGNNEPLQSAMSSGDWRSVAELRAGPGYGALGYDDALAAYADAYRRASVSHGGGDDDEDDKPKRPKSKSKRNKK